MNIHKYLKSKILWKIVQENSYRALMTLCRLLVFQRRVRRRPYSSCHAKFQIDVFISSHPPTLENDMRGILNFQKFKWLTVYSMAWQINLAIFLLCWIMQCWKFFYVCDIGRAVVNFKIKFCKKLNSTWELPTFQKY